MCKCPLGPFDVAVPLEGDRQAAWAGLRGDPWKKQPLALLPVSAGPMRVPGVVLFKHAKHGPTWGRVFALFF